MPHDAAPGHPNDALMGTRSAMLLRRTKRSRGGVRWVIGLAVAGALSLFLPWQQTVTGTGMVIALDPSDRPQTVQALMTGRIIDWLVQEGDTVVAGQPILRLAEVQPAYLDPQLVGRTGEQVDGRQDALVAKRNKADAYDQQIAALQRGQALQLEQTRAALRLAELQIEIDSAALVASRVESENLLLQAERQREMFERGFYGRTSFENAQNRAREAEAKLVAAQARLARSRQSLLQAQLELDAVAARYAENLAKARAERSATQAEIGSDRAEIARLQTSLASLEQRQAFATITAPQDGIIVQARRSGVGEVVSEGSAIATIQPSLPKLAVALYVKTMDVPLIQPGDPVRLQFDGFPALQVVGWPSVAVGTFAGRVAVVDQTSSTANSYRVIVVPDPEDEPWPTQIRMDSAVQGWALLREVMVGFELWRKINGFPPSLAAPPGSSAGSAGTSASSASAGGAPSSSGR